VLDAYVITILTLMGIWSIVALGLNVITGLAGQFNLGIGVYMGTGAYATAMLTTAAGFTFWEALPVAIAASALMGFLTGLPALRVREDLLCRSASVSFSSSNRSSSTCPISAARSASAGFRARRSPASRRPTRSTC
jgi:branched-subunit amino acid ABC-type transport system permease component